MHGSDRQLKPLHGIVLSARRESIAARLPAVTSTPSTCSIITKAPSARNRATNSHLHMFRIAGREYGPACSGDELGALDEKQFRIGDLVKTGDLAGYEYDFGDGWEHELAVEASAAADAAAVYPQCTGGEGACPPEDCGGPGGFAGLKELLAGPPGPEREEMRAWAGEEYDPAHFDLAAASAAAGSA